jgi:hypothetical protein
MATAAPARHIDGDDDVRIPLPVDPGRARLARGGSVDQGDPPGPQRGQIIKGDILIVVLVIAILVPSLANALFIVDVLRGVYR